MKLSQDPTARARMRLLRPWLTAEQFGAIERALEDVEVRSKPSLASRFSASWHAARIAWVAGSGRLQA
ncbi:MAG: hypothetical protein WBP72_00025 [Rhodocyclaceae bacterium]